MFYLIEKLKDNEKYKISKLNESKFWIQMSVDGKKGLGNIRSKDIMNKISYSAH